MIKIHSIFNPFGLVNKSIRVSLLQNRRFFNGLLLDLGAGEQPYADLVKRNCARYIAMDIEIRSKDPLDVMGNSLCLPYKDETFDSILCTEVLEHVSDPSALFKEAARVLKNGGNLVLTTPMCCPLHEEPHDYFRYTQYGLEVLSKRAGMKVISIGERGGAIIAMAQSIGMLLYSRYRTKRIRRVLFKSFMVPLYAAAKVLDKIWYNPKLTLGYSLVAEKTITKE